MKVTGYLSALLIEDLAKISGIGFKYPDRLTAAETASVRRWAQQQPEIAAAVNAGKGSGELKALMLYKDMVDHFEYEHPRDASGEPAPWPARPDEAQRPATTPDNPLGILFPDEAAALLAWAETSAEYQAIYHDKGHPQHADIVERTTALYARAGSATEAAAQDLRAEDARDATRDPEFQKRLEELRADPAYLDPTKPGHKEVVAKVSALYEQAAAGTVPRAAPGASVAAVVALAAKPHDQVAALKDNAAYWNKSDPSHAAAVERVSQAFAEAYPETPSGGGAS